LGKGSRAALKGAAGKQEKAPRDQGEAPMEQHRRSVEGALWGSAGEQVGA